MTFYIQFQVEMSMEFDPMDMEFDWSQQAMHSGSPCIPLETIIC